ncbi:CLUMA_CG019869, isoform A [Clunio marinus]|uniref:CLUMA_CG019869, isoform A n=1 Tax=Clunio marinus TaxID=568069 RepID=A0A1J1J6Y4_9DIPT|nr:CLUMA_CG019869, isoform A [Clunio marinus]
MNVMRFQVTIEITLIVKTKSFLKIKTPQRSEEQTIVLRNCHLFKKKIVYFSHYLHLECPLQADLLVLLMLSISSNNI